MTLRDDSENAGGAAEAGQHDIFGGSAARKGSVSSPSKTLAVEDVQHGNTILRSRLSNAEAAVSWGWISGHETDYVWLQVKGAPRDVTQRELHVLFSGCAGYRQAKVLRSTGHGSLTAQALVAFASEAEARAAVEARSDTTWSDKAFPVGFEIVYNASDAGNRLSQEGSWQQSASVKGKDMRILQDGSPERTSFQPVSPSRNGAPTSPTRSGFPTSTTTAAAGQSGAAKIKATLMLEAAMELNKMEDLARAIRVARQAGVEDHELEPAEAALAAIEWRIDARNNAANRDRKSMAHVRLAEALAVWNKDSVSHEKKVKVLKEARNAAKSAGMEKDDYAEVEAILAKQETKEKAAEGLEWLLSYKEQKLPEPDPRELRYAIIAARDTGVSDSALAQGAFLLATLERKAQARRRLKDALTHRGAIFTSAFDQQKLIGAFSEANEAGLEEDEMEAATDDFRFNRMKQAELKIQEAMRKKELLPLEEAIAEGRDAGVNEAVLEKATNMLLAQCSKLGVVDKTKANAKANAKGKAKMKPREDRPKDDKKAKSKDVPRAA